MSVIGKEKRDCLGLNKSATEDSLGPGSYLGTSNIGSRNKGLKFSNKSYSRALEGIQGSRPIFDIKDLNDSKDHANTGISSLQSDFKTGVSEVRKMRERIKSIPRNCKNIISPRPNNSFISKVQRFSFNKKETEYVPGPGSYAQNSHWDNKGTIKMLKDRSVPDLRVSKEFSGRNVNLPNLKSLCLDYINSEGSEFLKLKRISKNNSMKDDSVGPGQYNLSNSLQSGIKVNWHASNTSRELPSLKALKNQEPDIGPGKYFPVFGNEVSNAKAARRSLQNLSSLRKSKQEFLQKIKNKAIDQESLIKPVELKKDLPGPGYYNINFEIQTSTTKPEQFQFFGSTSDRFPSIRKDLEENNISPGKYSKEFPEKINFKLKRANKIKKEVPFGASEDRFYDKISAAPLSNPEPPAKTPQKNLQIKKPFVGSPTKKFLEAFQNADLFPQRCSSKPTNLIKK
ncbi:unnamed protein product [Moneuplotes crassus]|uniref:Uncharacterized protein n=1 Tax=Euplotes crassus TaxID=5936 RepID=A0AAD1XDA8_EUPCR|nr:unnamed protein product [Moneuplotes crassus]